MTINPRVGMWLSIVLAVIAVLASGSTQLTAIFGEHTANIILAVSVLVLGAGNAVNAVLHAIPSQNGPAAAAEFPLGPKAALAILLLPATIAAVLMGASPLQAADLPAKPVLKAPAPGFSFSGYPVNSGFYFGLNTEVAAGSANGVETGTVNQNTGKLFSAEGDIGLNVGYVWARQGQPIWYAVEGTFDWANVNAKTNGLSVSGPLNFEQIAILGAPWDQVAQFLPTINFGAFPGLPQLPSGTTAGPGAVYIFGGVREQDISAQWGVGQGRAWLVGLTTGIGSRWLLSNHAALDVRVEYLAPTNSVCFVNGAGKGCAGLGQGIGTRVSVLF